MSFTQQFVQLLSQLPGSIVYHVITLLAVQATLGMALWQRQRNPRDELANRLIWATGGILAGRLIVIFAILLTNDPVGALATLPPLDRAIDALTAALLVWALSPHPSSLPRLGDILLLITLIVIGFMYAVLAQDWIQQFDSAIANGSYAVSSQAIIWEVFQLAILALGSMLILLRRQEQWHLRLAIIGALFLAHLVNLFGGSQLLSPQNNIAYWVRLGNLIAFPLLAALAYRHNLSQLLPDADSRQPAPGRMAEHLQIAGRVVAAKNPQDAVQEALTAADDLIDAEFIALAIMQAESREHLVVSIGSIQTVSVASNGREGTPDKTTLLLSYWPAIRLSLHQLQPVELVPSGLGARQLNQLYQKLQVSGLGALLIEPLVADDNELGVLLLAGSSDLERWPSQQKRLSQAVADFLAVAINDSMRKENAQSATTSSANLATEAQTVGELTTALAATKLVFDDGKVQALESEVASLRKSLSAAEEALSVASQDGTNLSADWVTRTVTRYSGDLEDANERIKHLEATLVQTNDSRAYELIVDHTRQLRTPLTSLAGYTELLLGESLGFLGSKQMSLLRRMKLNAETIARSLDRISAVARQADSRLLSRATTDAREAIESAAQAMETQFQAKRLSMDLSLPDALPQVPSDNDGFFQIVVLLIRNACQVSRAGGRVTISARVVCIEETGLEKEDASSVFLHLSIADAGGRQTWDLHSQSLGSHQLDPSEAAANTERLRGIAEAVRLVAAHGGRTWVDQVSSNGCVFSVLLPTGKEDRANENCA
jgi:signal transduction histidine kinase